MQEGSLTTRDKKNPTSEHAAVVSYSSRVESVNCVDVGLRNATSILLNL